MVVYLYRLSTSYFYIDLSEVMILSKTKKSNTNEPWVVQSQCDLLCTPTGKYTKSHQPHIPTTHSQKAKETQIESKMTAKMCRF